MYAEIDPPDSPGNAAAPTAAFAGATAAAVPQPQPPQRQPAVYTPPQPAPPHAPAARHLQPQQRAEMSATHAAAAQESRRPLTFVGGSLPEDFLRLTVPVEVVDAPVPTRFSGEGTITLVIYQARLAKNYGFVRMDPACHITIGGLQAKTAVCSNGATEPRWNQRLIFPGISTQTRTAKLEIFDIGTFSDRRVAWADADIAQAMDGRPFEDWFHLTGKEGVNKEGVLHMHVSFQPTAALPSPQMQMPAQQFYPYPATAPSMPAHAPPSQYPPSQYPNPALQAYQGQSGAGIAPPQPQAPVQQQQQQQQQQQPQPQQPADISQLKEMFPDMEDDMLTDVLQGNQVCCRTRVRARHCTRRSRPTFSPSPLHLGGVRVCERECVCARERGGKRERDRHREKAQRE